MSDSLYNSISLAETFSRGKSVIISFFSSVVLSFIIVNNTTRQFEITIIVVEAFGIFIIVDEFLFQVLLKLETVTKRASYYEPLYNEFRHFFRLLGFFLIFQLILNSIRIAWEASQFTISESLAAIFSILLFTFNIFVKSSEIDSVTSLDTQIKRIEELEKEEKKLERKIKNRGRK